MKVFSLKEHFELRKTCSLGSRLGFGRYFEQYGQPGFSDASGAIWPVKIDDQLSGLKLQFGSIYRFFVKGERFNGRQVSKYRDGDTLLVISDLQLVSGEENVPWSLSRIADPRQKPICPIVDGTSSGTLFLMTATSSRVQKLRQRATAMNGARLFFSRRDYLELDPPVLVPSGALERYLKTFRTQYVDHRGNQWPMEMPTSPELALKKIIAEGAPRLFALTHAFRNEGELSKHHDPEFSLIEWYRLGEDFESLIIETQSLILSIASAIQSVLPLPSDRWPVFSVPELFASILSMDLLALSDVAAFRAAASTVCRSVVDTDSWDDVFCKLFMEFIEPFLAQNKACFVTHYPEQMGALASKSRQFKGCVDRFEAYIYGVEICNGYRELIDVSVYLQRMSKLTAERTDVFVDQQFESAMNVGLFPCLGNALGLDRLIALLLGEKHLQSILPWPFESRFPQQTIALE
jgi:lysyl-tRNA synthetase class 2